MSAKDDILNGGKRKKKKDNAAAPSQSNETVGGSGASVETKEVHLPNLNVRGKNKRKPLTLDVKPASPGPLQDKIDESKMPDMNLDIDLDNIDVVAKDKSKPLKLDIPATKQPEVDKRKIEMEVPLYVPTPERAKKVQEYAKNIKMAGIDIDEDAKKAPSLADKIEGVVPSSLSKWDSVLPEVVVKGKRPTVAQPTQAESDAKRKKFADDIYSKFAPYVMGPQATEETIKKGHSVYDIEKEKQAKRDQEKIDDYTSSQAQRIMKEAFKDGGTKPAAPVVDENVPIIDSTLEKEEALPVPEKKVTSEKKIDDYTSSQAQRIMKEAFKDGGTKPAAPVVDENVPIIDSTLEKEEALPVPEKKVTSEKKEEPTIPKANSVGSMMDIVDEYAKKMQPTEEELERERKRRKREAVIAAISDGTAALANLIATNHGAPNAKYTASMSTAMKDRYEKLRKEREEKAKEIMAYRMRAHESDRQQANADRNYAEGVRRYDTSLENTKKQQAQQQKNWETTRQDGINQRNQAQENWQKTFDANEAHRKSQTAIQQANAETAKKRAEAYAQRQAANQAGTLRGKKIGFSDGDKNEVAIYENVWKGSKQNVYNAIVEDGIIPKQIELAEMTPAKLDEWIKRNWTKSPKARAIMLALSDVDPAAVLSQVEGSEDESSVTTESLGRGSNNEEETDW